MKRSQVLLSILGAVLIVALFYVLLFQPSRERLAEVELETATEQQVQVELQQEIARLQSVREEAPEVEAELAAAEAIVPRDPALPAALRQLQLAADESDIVLQAVTTSRPAAIDGAPEGLSRIDVGLQLQGGYFQLIDFLRRVEDPAISPRGLEWSNASVLVDEYPDLTVALTGQLYAMIAVPVPDEPEPSAEDLETDATEDDADAESDADVEDVS